MKMRGAERQQRTKQEEPKVKEMRVSEERGSVREKAFA